MSGSKILLVEDEPEIRDLLLLYLTNSGFITVLAGDGLQAMQLFESEQPELILLDVGLPGLNGMQICEDIRAVSNVPIIFISCNQDADDIIQGLLLGADDYIVKPFDPAVVIARVKANLRRAPLFRRNAKLEIKADTGHLLNFGQVSINLHNYEVRVSNKLVFLSAKELQLLIYLAQNPDQVFTPEDLYAKIWETASLGDIRTVMVHISNLRKKIELDPEIPRLIQNIRGFGYKFSLPQ